MTITITRQAKPDLLELRELFKNAFDEVDNAESFAQEQDQGIDDWFDIQELEKYLSYGALLEARTEDSLLVGAIFIGKQHPLTWPDGRKMELFILAVHTDYRHQGIATNLIHKAEEYARESGAKALIVNSHVLMGNIHGMYEKFGFETIGTLKGYYDNGDTVFLLKKLG